MSEVTDDMVGSGEEDASVTLNLRIASVFILLVAGALGSLPPVVLRLRDETLRGTAFSSAKAFGGAVILTTGLVHTLPEAMELLSEKEEFPIGPSLCLGAIILMLFLEQAVTSMFRKSLGASQANGAAQKPTSATVLMTTSVDNAAAAHNHDGTGHHHDHVHLPAGMLATAQQPNLKAVVVAHVLELGIVAHSILIGISLGTLADLGETRTLLIALCFHQFFEGIGLGGAIAAARMPRVKSILFALLFCITTPVGVAIGIGITDSYDEESSRAIWTQGIIGAISSGILIYVGLVEMIVEDFTQCGSNTTKRTAMCLAVLLGYASMTVLAKWA